MVARYAAVAALAPPAWTMLSRCAPYMHAALPAGHSGSAAAADAAGADGPGSAAWAPMASVLAQPGKRAVAEPSTVERAARLSSAGLPPTAQQQWVAAQAWKRADASDGQPSASVATSAAWAALPAPT